MTKILRLPANTSGRDLVVGDIHGEFHVVLAALERVGYDPDADRLFCVGDLVDRGSDSRSVLSFLDKTRAFCVMGNHEAMVLEAQDDPMREVPHIWALNCSFNGQGWWPSLPPDERDAIALRFASLPLCIEIGGPADITGICHAEVPVGSAWWDFTKALSLGDPVAIESCLWGRERLKHAVSDPVPGVARVFSGHSVLTGGPEVLGNHFFIDTGSVFGINGSDCRGHLSIVSTDVSPETLAEPRSTPGLAFEIRGVPSPSIGTPASGFSIHTLA